MLATPVTSNWTLQEKIIIFPQNFTIVLFAKLGEKKDINIHYMSYYHKWKPQDNYYYSVENCNFEANPERSEGT